MNASSRTKINHPGVLSMCPAKAERQSPFALWDGKEMNMIAHEAPRPDGNATLIGGFGNHTKVVQAILIAEEYILSANSPLGNVLWKVENDLHSQSGDARSMSGN